MAGKITLNYINGTTGLIRNTDSLNIRTNVGLGSTGRIKGTTAINATQGEKILGPELHVGRQRVPANQINIAYNDYSVSNWSGFTQKMVPTWADGSGVLNTVYPSDNEVTTVKGDLTYNFPNGPTNRHYNSLAN